MPEAPDLFDQSRSRDAFDRSFTGRINIQNQHHVGQIERPRKVVEQMHGAGKAVRLKDGKNPAKLPDFAAAQRRADFGGMMRIVVDDGDSVAALDLKSPIHSLKVRQSRGDDSRIDAHVARGGKSGGGVQHVVMPGT